MDESKRLQEKIQPPDPDDWSRQLSRMWVFSELICDSSRNLTNILMTEDWKLWMIDFTSAFRPWHDLLEPKHLMICDRRLLQSLREVKEVDVLERTKPHLGLPEVKALMARRDKIVTSFEKKIALQGEGVVLF
jgi:hypothetical protein